MNGANLVRASLLLVALLLLPGRVFACEYSEPPSLRESLAVATSIFVFRLESARVSHVDLPGGITEEGENGTIAILRVLKGKKPAFHRIAYISGLCGGVRLDVGHSYLVATNQDGQVLTLAAAERSVVDTTIFPEVLGTVRSYLSGTPLPEQFPSNDAKQYMSVLPPPPPPPPRR